MGGRLPASATCRCCAETSFSHEITLLRFLFNNRFFKFRFESLALNNQPQTIVKTHVLVRDPDERKASDQVAAPVVEEQFISRNYQEDGCNVMAETILTGEEVKKFALVQALTTLALIDAVFAWLMKDFFMRHRPRDTRDGYREDEQCDDL